MCRSIRAFRQKPKRLVKRKLSTLEKKLKRKESVIAEIMAELIAKKE
jgi:hypothetical protein